MKVEAERSPRWLRSPLERVAATQSQILLWTFCGNAWSITTDISDLGKSQFRVILCDAILLVQKAF